MTSSRLASSNMTGCPGRCAAVHQRLAHHHLGAIGQPVDLAGAGAESGGGDAHGGQGPEARGHGGQDGGARGRGELDASGPDPTSGSPRSSRTTAGDGLGRNPWALRTVPMPVATGDDVTSSTPRTSIAAAVPTTSITVSCDPTSWKCTCSGGRRWSLPSTSASSGERVQSPSCHSCGQAGLLDQPDDVRVGPHDDVVGRLHHGPGRRDAGPEDRLGAEAPTPERAAAAGGEHLGEVGAGIEQAARAPCRRRCPRSSGTTPRCAVPRDAADASGSRRSGLSGHGARAGARRIRCRSRPR